MSAARVFAEEQKQTYHGMPSKQFSGSAVVP